MNNEANYEVVANGNTLPNALGVENIHIWTDSQVFVGHMEHIPRGTDAYTPRPGLGVGGLGSSCAKQSLPGQRHLRDGSGGESLGGKRGKDHPSPSNHLGEHEG
ncbi:hypothetical protein LIER_23976 [Lithospermum erythrorhizon]|uniref:RNase H type-1 domain-containing protein n=1 Tax=Lithospermum erythrorhizon TaxID=34254 RepID=A0AAV3R2P4_LITER